MTETAGRLPASVRPCIAIVGAGRAGAALAVALHRRGYRIAAVQSRTPAAAAELAALVNASVAATALGAICAADITLITVPAPELVRVAATVAATGYPLPRRVVVHCDGGRPREVLSALRSTSAAVGAMHPLQALSGAASAELLDGSAFAVDADPAARASIRSLVLALGGVSFDIAPEHRALYHAAAVLVGNASLGLLSAATTLLGTVGVAPDVAARGLGALLEGAARNARRDGARGALTGPIARNDAAAVASHLQALAATGDATALRVYVDLGRELLALVGRDGRESVAAVLDEVIPPPESLQFSASPSTTLRTSAA